MLCAFLVSTLQKYYYILKYQNFTARKLRKGRFLTLVYNKNAVLGQLHTQERPKLKTNNSGVRCLSQAHTPEPDYHLKQKT